MKNVKTIVSSALTTVIAIGVLGLSSEVIAADKDMGLEKCYGVTKAGKNDCKTASNACAGHSVTDAQKDAFIAVPNGTCERIVGGNTKAGM